MFSKRQRITSILLTIVFLLSVCPLAIFSQALQSSETFTPERHYFDFGEYRFNTVTLEELTAAPGNYKGTTVNAASGKNIGTWSLESDSTATGGKYLKFVKDNNGFKDSLMNYLFVANPTGNFQTNDRESHIVLKAGTPYSIKLRYRVENLEEEKYDLNLMAVATQGVATPNSCSANIVYIEKGLGNTDGWTEAVYSFVTPDTYAGKVNSLLIGFNPCKKGTTSRPSEGTKYTYSVSVDSVEINRLATVRLNGVDSTGHKSTESIYGAVGEVISFPDKGTTLYESYNEKTGEFSNPVDTAGRKFTNSVYEDFYYKDDTFEPESHNIDFSKYNLICGNTGGSGNVVKINSNSWELVTDSTASGGKYLKYEKLSSETGKNWKPYYHFMANPTGAYNGATKSGAVKLTKDTNYVIKVRYKIENLDKAYDLAFYANFTQGVWSPNSFHANNNVNIATGLGNTDGWVEKEYTFKTPSTYVGTANSLILGFYPTKAGTQSFPMNDSFAYSVCIDYVKIDRATSVVFMSGEDTVKTVYAAPEGTFTDFPSTKRNGYKFAGWFGDAACTVSANSVKLVNKGISATLYAGWLKLADNAVISDELYPSWRDNGDVYSGFTSDNSEFFTGSSSVKYSAGGKAYMLLNSDTQPLIIADGSVYMLTFMYKLKNAGRAEIGFAASGNNKFEADSAVTQCTKAVVGNGGWQKAVITFTANAETADALYLTAASAESLWLDDITLSATSTIVMETNGGAPIESIKGVPNEKAALPEPVWAGHAFSGWYKDSELTVPATAVRFPTESESITVYAAWDKKPPEAVIDFENVPYENGTWKNPQFSYNSDTMKFVNDNAFSGDSVLRFAYASGKSTVAYNRAAHSFAFYKDGAPVKVTDKATYAITFWYRASGLTTDVRITPQTCTAYNFYANAVNHTNGGYTINKASADGEWHQATIVFTAEPKNDSNGNPANALFLRINPLTDESVTVDLDYITLSEIDESTAVVSMVIDSTETQFATVEKGGKVTLPTPSRENYIFRGWYSDSSFKNKLEGTEYSAAASAAIYAKWSLTSAAVDFEDYPVAWINKPASNDTNFRFGNDHMSISDSEYHSGSHSLCFSFDGTQEKKESMAQLYNLNDVFVAGDTPLVLDENSTYMVTLRYKVKNAVGTADIDLALANRSNYYANRTRIKFFTTSFADIAKGWQTATICFTANPKKEKADALYLAFTANGSSAEIYIDDFSVELLENKSYVEFNANNNTLPAYSVGKAGDAVNFPEAPYRKGYTFAGWYTDEGFTKLYTGKLHGEASLKVYAKWSFADSILISFEDEAQRSLNKNQYDTTEISDEMASDGKYSLKLNKSGNTRMNASMLLIYDNQPVTVEEGATYVLTYDYYVVQNSGKSSGQTTPLPNVRFAKATNVWSGYSVPKNIWAINYEEECGKWFTGSVMFTVELKEPTGNALYFTANYSENFVGYFDNLRLTRLDKGKDGIAVNLNPGGASDVGSSKLFYTGKAGDALKLPTDLKKDGYVFLGWYEDTKLKKRIEAEYYTVLQSDTTIYAGWAKPKLYQDFEGYGDLFVPNTYKYLDMDYELYNANAAQGSKDNVHSGSYSIHRKGEDFHTACFQILPETSDIAKRLVPGMIYKMSMWVKLESKAQETGAIKIACSQSPHYAWAIDGEWHNVAALSDLKVGEWTELTYTFSATDYYMSVQTPGNVCMYFDDVSFELLYGAKTSDCSESVKVEEYIAVSKNEDGSILNSDINTEYLKELGEKGNNTVLLVVIIGGAVLLLGAAGAVTAIIIRKRKRVKRI